VDLFGLACIRADDVETGDLNDSVGEPETAIAAQGSSAECVADGLKYRDGLVLFFI
jgi:hypothetical protein